MRRVNDIVWHAGIFVFLGIAGLSVWGLLAFDTPCNAPFLWSWRYLALPVLGLGWLYGYSQRRYFLQVRRMKRDKFWFCMVVFPLLVLICCGGVVSLINGSFPTDRTVLYRGPLANLVEGKRRHRECQVTLRDEATSRDVTLGVNRSEYATLTAGQTYSRRMRIGLLGIPFCPMKDRRQPAPASSMR